jgi:hypothetical protein
MNGMKPAAVTLVALLALAGAALVTAPAVAADAGAEPAACVAIRAEVRYGAAGYNHIVVLTNACAKPQVCTVTTDVNPEPIKATVPPRSTTDVVTFMGSPARVFVPHAICVASP